MNSYFMQAVARYIQRALAEEGCDSLIYLGDILLVSVCLEAATRTHTITHDILADLALPVAEKKLHPPARKFQSFV